MSAPDAPPAARGREVAWLGKAVGAADDAALQRAVTFLDGLRNRGDADAVLEQARKRLRVLRPARPLGFWGPVAAEPEVRFSPPRRRAGDRAGA
jgi:hypothetical protein